MKTRRLAEINTESLFFDFIGIIESPLTRGHPDSHSRIIEHISNQKSVITDRCEEVSEFFGTSNNDGEPGHCRCDYDKFRTRLQKTYGERADKIPLVDEILRKEARNRIVDCTAGLTPANLAQTCYFALGRMDYCALIPVHHNYWTCRSRSHLSWLKGQDDVVGIEGIICAPTTRIKCDVDTVEGTFGPGDNSSKLNIFTFLEFPAGLRGSRGPENETTSMPARGIYLRDLVDNLYGGVDGDGNPVTSRFFDTLVSEVDSEFKIDVFMTLSTIYPLMVRSNHSSVDSVRCYLDILEKHRAADVSDGSKLGDWYSIFGINPHSDLDEIENESDALDDNSILSFYVLFRFKSTPTHRFLDEIKRKIERVAKRRGDDPYDLRASSQYGQWNYVLHCVPRALRELLRVVQELNGNQEIERTALVPTFSKKISVMDNNRELDQVHVQPKAIEVLNDTIEQSGKRVPKFVRLEDLWSRKINPEIPVESKSSEIVNFMLYNIKFDWEWLAGYVSKFSHDWEQWSQQSRVYTGRAQGSTCFDLIANYIKTHIDDICSLYDTIDLEMDLVKEAVRTISDGNQTVKEILAEKTQNLSQKMWKICKNERETIESVKEAVSTMLSAYRDRSEASLLVSTLDPLRHATDQSGIDEISVESARRLFSDYYGRARDKSVLLEEINAWKDRKKLKKNIGWDGIIACSTGYDFSVHTQFHLLYLPVDFKFRTKSKLVLLAHEAAHCTLHIINRSEKAFGHFRENFIEHWKSAAIEQVKKYFGDRRPVYGQLKNVLEKQLGDDQQLNSNELLCDVFAALTAGPAFYKGLFPETFKVTDTVRSDGHSYSLVGWIRLRTGLAVARALDWFGADGQGGGDPWELFEEMEDSLKYYCGEFYEKEARLEKPIRPIEEMDELEKVFTSGYYWLLKALEADSDLVLKLCEILEAMGDCFMFYPFVYDREMRKVLRDSVNSVCENIMYRMMFEDQVVMEHNPRMVTAAALLPPYGRPYHSGVRVIHSLFYSYARHGESVGLALDSLEPTDREQVREDLEKIHAKYLS